MVFISYQDNVWLEKYEIKKPDYDLIDRAYVGMRDAEFKPARFVKQGNYWVPKNLLKRHLSSKTAKIMFVGDITCFAKQFEEAKENDGYDFYYEFEQVQPIFAQSDLTVGNLETMIVPEAPYRTEKLVSEQNFHCNAPLEFLDAIRKAGIDVLTNANNHDMDTGAVGIGETIDHIEQFGFIQTGTFKSDKKRYELINVAGFKVAIVAFATEHNNKGCNLTPEGREFLLCDYSPAKARTIIEQARSDGAELVFVCIHWGTEHKEVHNNTQLKIARELGAMGYDCIIGSHPHVLQPFVNLEVGKKNLPVFFSMGNFVSHNSSGPKSRSVIACVELERTADGIALNCSYIPVHTSKNFGDKKYVVLPLAEKSLDVRNKKKKAVIEKVIGNEIPITASVQYSEKIEKLDVEAVTKVSKAAKKLKLPTIPRKVNGAVAYDDGNFSYLIEQDTASIVGISSESTSTAISVPASVSDVPITKFGVAAFENNESLKKINFRKTIPVISDRLCRNCINLEGFQLGASTSRIGDEAFSGCVNLTAAVMKNSVKTIGKKAFSGCKNLRSVKIPAGVKEIADDAFENCLNVIFYCEPESYAEQYANAHNFKVVRMNLKD